MNTYHIYILFDPTFVSKTYYIGYTNNPSRRLKQHINDYSTNPYKTAWIRKLKFRGILPAIYSIYQYLTEDDVLKAEIELIAFLKYIGVKLCNISSGGNRPPSSLGKQASNETKQKLSESHKGQVAWNSGLKMSEQIINKNSLSHIGQQAWNKNKKMSNDYKEKCRKRQLGIKQSKETIVKRIAAQMGENNTSAKLTVHEVIKIRDLYNIGEYTYKQLAIQFNINKTTIAQIINRKTWVYI